MRRLLRWYGALLPKTSSMLVGAIARAGRCCSPRIDARLSPDGKDLLVDGSGMHFVSVFAVNGGTFTELPTAPTPLLTGTPVVLAAHPPVRFEADCVLLDDFGGSWEATRQLIAAGHRKIAFLGLA